MRDSLVTFASGASPQPTDKYVLSSVVEVWCSDPLQWGTWCGEWSAPHCWPQRTHKPEGTPSWRQPAAYTESGLWVARPGHFCPTQATLTGPAPPRAPRAFAGLQCTWLPLTVSPLPSQGLIPNKHLGIPNSVLTSASGNDVASFNVYKHCGRSDGNFIDTPQTPTWKGGSRSLSLYNNGSQPFCVLDILLNTVLFGSILEGIKLYPWAALYCLLSRSLLSWTLCNGDFQN